ncbi:MAG: hypothetical protein V4505_06155 [Pseudomonadota bacterium]
MQPPSTQASKTQFHFVYPQGAVPTLVLTAAHTTDGSNFAAEVHLFSYPKKTASALLTHCMDTEKPGTETSIDQMLQAALNHGATMLNAPDSGATFPHLSPLALQAVQFDDVAGWRRAGHIHGMAGVTKLTTIPAVREVLGRLVKITGAQMAPLVAAA